MDEVCHRGKHNVGWLKQLGGRQRRLESLPVFSSQSWLAHGKSNRETAAVAIVKTASGVTTQTTHGVTAVAVIVGGMKPELTTAVAVIH